MLRDAGWALRVPPAEGGATGKTLLILKIYDFESRLGRMRVVVREGRKVHVHTTGVPEAMRAIIWMRRRVLAAHGSRTEGTCTRVAAPGGGGDRAVAVTGGVPSDVRGLLVLDYPLKPDSARGNH
mmetsp:Transcript_5728/g.12022  ORF Transcript_5728/g.12022 Transcript_5728/m.12022 type:complete len:125 (+) Transcript_5728:981-1355(+)